MGVRRIVRTLGLLAVILVGLAYAFQTAGPCSVPEETGLGGWVCKPHRKAGWGRCGE
jgi:hypothetical protein